MKFAVFLISLLIGIIVGYRVNNTMWKGYLIDAAEYPNNLSGFRIHDKLVWVKTTPGINNA